MKKLNCFIQKGALFTLLIGLMLGCNKDDDSQSNEIQLNDFGLQIGIEPINQDTLAVYKPSAIEIIGQQIVSINDFGTEYTLNVSVSNPKKIKKGNVIVDYSNGGRLWIIKSVPDGGNGVRAKLGSLDTFYLNTIVEVSTPTNRAKEASSNPNKLESGKFKLYSGTNPLITLDLSKISIREDWINDGVTLSVEDNTVNINLNNVELYSNNSNTFKINIIEGSLMVNNAIDLRYKYLPLSSVLVGVPVTIGSLKEFNSSIYTTIDTQIKLDIEATTNGEIDLIDPINKELVSYTKIIPIPPYFAASVKVSLKAKLTATTEAQLNITPEISTKNNFEARATYEGLLSTPILQADYQNIETRLTNSIIGNFDLNQRLEIIPEVEIYAFGLLGPSGELIAYEELNANAFTENGPITWDTQIDLGIDHRTSLDVSIFHIDQLSVPLLDISGNIFNYDLFTSPNSTEVISGNNQIGQINTSLPNPIEIEIRDNLGEKVANVPVFFETQNGSFQNNYVVTNFEGVAINEWTLGSLEGNQTANIFVKDGNGNLIPTTEITINATAENGSGVNPANAPNPEENAQNVPVNGILSFTEGENTPNDATFRVYFDTNSNPLTEYNLDVGQTTLDYSSLQENTTHYWRVETISNTNEILATSPIWNFTTETSSGGTFFGNVDLTTQTEVNDFGSNNYSVIDGWLFIDGASINDLSPLSSLNSVSGLLTVQGTQLMSLTGLNNITQTGGLNIRNTTLLLNLADLNNITMINGLCEIANNSALTNLNGLSNLNLIQERLYINHNVSLSNINGLSSLTTINGFLNISDNDNLMTLDGLENLMIVGDDLTIRFNDAINDFCAIQGLLQNNGVMNGILIANNLFNPTVQDIIDGNCSQ